MNKGEYDSAYRDGALAMREAIAANLENLKKRLHSSDKYNLATIEEIFVKIFNMVDIRVDGEPDKEDIDAAQIEEFEPTGSV